MRNNLIILCVCMILTVLPMRATTPAYQVTISEPFADRPEYVVARSGDMNPFGASEQTRAQVRRGGRPDGGGKTDGDTTNPNIEMPIGEGMWLLVLLALAYAIVKRRKYFIQ